jgi:phosphoribosyl 1,2-cyclic phosphodiesterase
MARFFNLFSGSKRNSTYIGSGNGAILIDAGRSAKQIVDSLESRDFSMNDVKGIFITHEHSDHVAALNVLLNKYDIKVYATKGTANALYKYNLVPENTEVNILDYSKDTSCGDLSVKTFKTSHDSAESCGYVVTTPDERKIAVCTDLGYISDEVEDNLMGCDLVMIESNHDVNMLRMSSYPQMLKRRILGDRGHLSNDTCSNLLPKLVKNGTTRICLAHLSRENNIPVLADRVAKTALECEQIAVGKDCLLSVLEEKSTKKATVF